MSDFYHFNKIITFRVLSVWMNSRQLTSNANLLKQQKNRLIIYFQNMKKRVELNKKKSRVFLQLSPISWPRQTVVLLTVLKATLECL